MRIDHEGPEFPYLQIAAQLRQAIADGTYPPGRAIPSIKQLVADTGCGSMTVRRAVRLLEDEGLVRTIPGRGTFVREVDDDIP